MAWMVQHNAELIALAARSRSGSRGPAETTASERAYAEVDQARELSQVELGSSCDAAVAWIVTRRSSATGSSTGSRRTRSARPRPVPGAAATWSPMCHPVRAKNSPEHDVALWAEVLPPLRARDEDDLEHDDERAEHPRRDGDVERDDTRNAPRTLEIVPEATADPPFDPHGVHHTCTRQPLDRQGKGRGSRSLV